MSAGFVKAGDPLKFSGILKVQELEAKTPFMCIFHMKAIKAALFLEKENSEL